jgi:hypothetical protein
VLSILAGWSVATAILVWRIRVEAADPWNQLAPVAGLFDVAKAIAPSSLFDYLYATLGGLLLFLVMSVIRGR